MNKYLLVFASNGWNREIHIPFLAIDNESAQWKANKLLAIWYADGDEEDTQHKLFLLTEVEVEINNMTLRELINQVTNNDLESGVLDSSPALDYEIMIKEYGEYGSYSVLPITKVGIRFENEKENIIIIED